MIKRKVAFSDWLQTGLIRLCRIHFMFIGAYAIYVIAADATRLIAPPLVLKRWTVDAALLVGVSIIWYLARARVQNINYYRGLVYGLIVLDLAMAAFNVYTQRGMAARAVMLFSIPIVAASVLLSRTALFLTAALCTAAYSLAALKYFVDFFNEGYKAELYIEVGFYCAVFFILAAVLSIVVRSKNSEAGPGS